MAKPSLRSGSLLYALAFPITLRQNQKASVASLRSLDRLPENSDRFHGRITDRLEENPHDAGISQMTGYLDGVAGFPVTCSGALAMPVGSLNLSSFSGGLYVQSTLDELRITANATRASAWIATEYANQQSPATFYS